MNLPTLSVLLTLIFIIDSSLSLVDSLKIFYDSSNHRHRDLSYHPEQPTRITACATAIDKWKKQSDQSLGVVLVDVAAPGDDIPLGDVLADELAPFSAQQLNLAKETLAKTHDLELLTRLETTCAAGREDRIAKGKDPLGYMGTVDGGDTYLTTYTYDVCLRATATWIQAVQEAGQSGCAVALTRPPGHHATFSTSNGFCHVNFCAAATVRFLEDHPDTKVSILDWDVHYGQGVADIVKKHRRARYVSIHQSPAFPYMGEQHQIDENVLTIPIPMDTSWTSGYRDAFQQALNFVHEPGVWEPSLVLVCAGYDALDSDELASCALQAQNFGEMTGLLLQHVGAPSVPVMFGLEGGYQLSEFAGGGGMPVAVVETMKAIKSYKRS